MLCAARDGDLTELRRLLAEDSNLYRAEYWYTQPIHFAVREGHLAATLLLLEAGADPGWVGLSGESLAMVARDRGHEELARLLELQIAELRQDESELSRPPVAPIHEAAQRDDVAAVRALLDSDESLLYAPGNTGCTPLGRAVEAGATQVAFYLLGRGADPNWPDGADAPSGSALHVAARAGQTDLVERLLGCGADPNATIESAGSATFAAATPELRALLVAHGGRLDPFDLVFLGEHDEALRRVMEDPASANAGCGGVLAAACTLGRNDLLVRLLATGVRVPDTLTECRSYLWSDPEMLRLLIASGMDPNLPDWLRAAPLHSLCERDGRGRARPHRIACAEILLAAGADLEAIDDDYRSTPLGWAARNGLEDMVDFLLQRGASTQLPEDKAWLSPAGWAQRRGHHDIERRLQRK